MEPYVFSPYMPPWHKQGKIYFLLLFDHGTEIFIVCAAIYECSEKEINVFFFIHYMVFSLWELNRKHQVIGYLVGPFLRVYVSPSLCISVRRIIRRIA